MGEGGGDGSIDHVCTFSLWPKGWEVGLEGLDNVSIASYWTFSYHIGATDI